MSIKDLDTKFSTLSIPCVVKSIAIGMSDPLVKVCWLKKNNFPVVESNKFKL